MLFVCFFLFFARVLAYTMIMGKTANVRIREKCSNWGGGEEYVRWVRGRSPFGPWPMVVIDRSK